jgi:hypothetical protein
MEKRKDDRFRTRFDALYSSGPSEGAGVLVELSCSGACVEEVSHWPAVGTRVRLYVFIQPVQPFEITGYVVRRTTDGFAITYDMADEKLRQLVGDVAAVVQTPS